MTPADGGAAGVSPTYAIADDLSGVIKTDDGFGSFPTKEAALVDLIERLEMRRLATSLRLSQARRALRAERAK